MSVVLSVFKRVASLPATLVANAVYLVRVGTGFDLYVTNSDGSVAHGLNQSVGSDVYDPDSAVYLRTSDAIYRAWVRTDGAGYLSVKYGIATGEKVGDHSASLPMPSDLSSLSYS